MPPRYNIPPATEFRAKVGSALEHYQRWNEATDRWTNRNKFYDSEIAQPSKRYKSDPSVARKRKMVKRTRYRSGRRRSAKRFRPRRSVLRRLPRALTTKSKVITCKAVDYHDYAGTGSISCRYVQINSCDDPFVTSGAGQPLGYDQWKTLYKKAIVIGASLNIKWHNRGTSAAIVGIYPADINQGVSNLSSYEHYMEMPKCKTMLLSPEMDHTIMTYRISTKRHMQIKDIRDNPDFLWTLDTETPPTKITYFHLFAQAVDQASTYAVDCVVNVSYIVLLLDPIIPARSVDT